MLRTLGNEKPSRVPCPPASSKIAIFPSEMAANESRSYSDLSCKKVRNLIYKS